MSRSFTDGSEPDREVPDQGVPDRGVPDRGVPDRGVPDRGVPDRGVPDRGVPDRGALDGNALAGALSEVFTVDITAAVGQCAHCLRTGPLAEASVYPSAPGLVARCPGCGEVVLRLVRASGRAWLDLRGLHCLQISLPPED